MFKMGCSMARRILGPGSATGGGDQEQASTCFSAAHSTGQDGPKKSSAKLSNNNSNNSSVKPNQPSSELNDFSKLEHDPRLPLNVRQIFKITKSWKAIARTMSKTGTAMFLNLFEQNENLFHLFDRFQHLKGKELHESMELREHAATVMATLDTSINSLSDYDNFVTYLHSIGQLHRKVPGFKREYFWEIEQPFMKAVKQTLDERCNETIEEIYKIAIKLIIETIADGYGHDQDAAAQENNSVRKDDGGGLNAARREDNSPPSDRSGQSNNNNSNKNNDNNNFGPGKSEGRRHQAAVQCRCPIAAGAAAAERQASLKQNQQTPNCIFAQNQMARGDCGGERRDRFKVFISERTKALNYSLAAAGRALGQVCLQWIRKNSSSNQWKPEGVAVGPADPNSKSADELILATCKLMNATETLIDNCSKSHHFNSITPSPSQPKVAAKLTKWRGLVANLNSLLMDSNTKGRSKRQNAARLEQFYDSQAHDEPLARGPVETPLLSEDNEQLYQVPREPTSSGQIGVNDSSEISSLAPADGVGEQDQCRKVIASAKSNSALLLDGERNVKKLLLDVEQQQQQGAHSSGGGELIEFIKVIILINKLILTLVSATIETNAKLNHTTKSNLGTESLAN